MSSGDKKEIRKGAMDSFITCDWVDPLLETSRQKEEEKEKLGRLHKESRKILSLLGFRSSPIPPEAGTGLDVLLDELEQIQVDVCKLQAAYGAVTKLLPPDALQHVRKDLAEEDWVIPNDMEGTEEAGTAGGASPPETCVNDGGKGAGVAFNRGSVQSSEVDDNIKDEKEEEVVEEDIGALTTAEEDQRILYQYSVLRNLVPLVTGKSLEGKSLAELSTGIPTTSSLVISIANYMDVALEQPAIFHVANAAPAVAPSSVAVQPVAKYPYTVLPTSASLVRLPAVKTAGVSASVFSPTVGVLTTVQPRTTEVVRVQSRTPRQVGDKISGLLGYKIPNTDRKLFINFEVTQTGATFIGLSLGPDRLTVSEEARYYIWYQTDYSTFRPDTRRNGQKGLGAQLVVSNENLRAWGEISGGTKATIKVAIWSDEDVKGLVRDWKPRMDELARLIGPVRKPFACKLVLDNSLKVDLFEDDLMLKSGMTQADISSVLRPSQTESLLVSGAKSAEGLLLYKIGRTDIKLAIAFWVLPNNSSFAISFVGAESVCNYELLTSLSTNLKDWTRSSFKLASSSDGEQQIQIRNLVAKAVMSNAHGSSNLSCHSLLKVSIQARKSSANE